MGSAECSERTHRYHQMLVRVFTAHRLRTSDSDAERACFYEGLYVGAVEQVSQEYASCGASASFSCVDPSTVASYAAASLRALLDSAERPWTVDADMVRRMYGHEDLLAPATVPVCRRHSRAARDCEGAIRATMGPHAAHRPDLAEALAGSVCGG